MPEKAENVHDGHRKRLRQRYLTQGLEGFQPHEALELLLFYAIPRRDTNLLAHQLINRFGSLEAVLSAAPQELAQVEGVGESAAVLVSLLKPVTALASRSREKKPPRLENLQSLMDYCRALPFPPGQETFYLICMDAQWRVVHTEALFSGTINMVGVHSRIIVETALRHHACYAAVAHNHSSGAAEPSPADIEMTAKIKASLEAIDIQLYDHIIVAGEQTVSLRRLEQLQQTMECIGRDYRAAAENPDARPRRKKT